MPDPFVIPLTAVTVTLLLFVLGMAYAAGKHVTRIDHLEAWRQEFRVEIHDEMRTLHGHMGRIERLIRDGAVNDDAPVV